MNLQTIKKQIDALLRERGKQTEPPPITEMVVSVVDSETGEERMMEHWTIWPQWRLVWKAPENPSQSV